MCLVPPGQKGRAKGNKLYKKEKNLNNKTIILDSMKDNKLKIFCRNEKKDCLEIFFYILRKHLKCILNYNILTFK